ncbi:MAG: flagellar transcriptional regulator FlhC [Betaproteobacteria bacterium]
MRNRSVVTEAREIRVATDLIGLDARLQVLESETQLSRERLLRLYKELKGKSPPKGMLPFSTDWFMTWQPNTHASLFIALHEHIDKACALDEVEVLIKAYRLYLEQVGQLRLPVVLSLTRAWRLVKFFDCGLLTTAPCTRCHGQYVVHNHELVNRFICGLCQAPSRAGKTRPRPGAATLN